MFGGSYYVSTNSYALRANHSASGVILVPPLRFWVRPQAFVLCLLPQQQKGLRKAILVHLLRQRTSLGALIRRRAAFMVGSKVRSASLQDAARKVLIASRISCNAGMAASPHPTGWLTARSISRRYLRGAPSSFRYGSKSSYAQPAQQTSEHERLCVECQFAVCIFSPGAPARCGQCSVRSKHNAS